MSHGGSAMARAVAGGEGTGNGGRTTGPRGACTVVRRTATVTRGSALDRLRAKVEGYLELTELYEVSFAPVEATP